MKASRIITGLLLCGLAGIGLSLAAGSVTPTMKPLSLAPEQLSLAPSETMLSPAETELDWVDEPEETLHWDVGDPQFVIGMQGGGTFYAAARFTAPMNCTLKALLFFQNDPYDDDKVFVWGPGTNIIPGAVVDSVPYNGNNTQVWVRVDMTSPIIFPGGGDFWVGPRVNHNDGEHPLSVDAGPMVPDRGGFVSPNGVSWQQLAGVGADNNWNLRAIVGISAGWEHDVGVSEIVSPSVSVRPGSLTPKVMIENVGISAEEDIPVYCWVDSAGTRVYESNLTYYGPLDPGASAEVEFLDVWDVGPVGASYDVVMFTDLGTDEDRSNDTAYLAVTARAAEDTLHYDGPNNDMGVGIGGGGTYIGAVRFTPTAVCTLKSLLFYQYDRSLIEHAFVWGQGTNTTPGPVLDSIPYSGAASSRWKQIDLNAPIPQSPGVDFWVGVRITHADQLQPLGVDSGPMVLDRGGFMYLYGTWHQLVNLIGDYNWNIRAITTPTSGIAAPDRWIPSQRAPRVACPSPIRDQVEIGYHVDHKARVNLSIYDATGTLVRTLVDREVEAGDWSATWNRTSSSGRCVANGTYFYRLTVDGESSTGKAVVLD